MFGRECDPIGRLELITVTREDTDIPEDGSIDDTIRTCMIIITRWSYIRDYHLIFRAVYILGFTYTAIIAITDDR